MPKTTKSGDAKQSELPATLKRSPEKAQRAKAHDSAAEEYEEGERAHRTAYAAVKQKFEKIGDHWERKGGSRSGASDGGGRGDRNDTHGGVDANASKSELYDIAKRLDISGRSKMDKRDLVKAIENENGRRTRNARNP